MPRAGEHRTLRNVRVPGERNDRVLHGEDRVEIVERRVGNELHAGVQEWRAVRPGVGRYPLVVDADPGLCLATVPEVAQVAEDVRVDVEVKERFVEGGEIGELEPEIEVWMTDVGLATFPATSIGIAFRCSGAITGSWSSIGPSPAPPRRAITESRNAYAIRRTLGSGGYS